MIARKRVLLVGLFIAAVLPSVMARVSAIWEEKLLNQNQFQMDSMTRYRTYLISEPRWLNFQLPNQATALRLFTNAALSEAAIQESLTDKTTDSRDRPGHRYCVEYQLLDRSGRVILESEYHFRSPLDDRAGPDNLGVTSCFEQSPLIPASTRTMQLPLKQLDAVPDRVRVRLASKDPSVSNVVARLYVCQPRPGYDSPATTWPRLSKQARDNLARASVYPPELMNNFEKRSLLRWKWSAGSPIGLESRDFAIWNMYVSDDVRFRAYPDRQDDIDVDANRNFVVALPDVPGTVNVALDPFSELGSAEQGTCEIRWFGRTMFERNVEKHSLNESRTISIRPSSTAGLLEIASNVPAAAQITFAADDSSGEPIDITPLPRPIRVYEATSSEPVEYSVSHVGDEATPFRVTMRSILPPDVSTQNLEMVWQFLDEQDAVVDEGRFVWEGTNSVYDQIVMDSERILVTEPVTKYFRLPRHVSKVRLMSLHDRVLVTAQTRPANLPKATFVPADYLPINRIEAKRMSWFSIRPVRYSERIAMAKSLSCYIQLRPPVAQEHLVTGDYQWEDFTPKGRIAGREFLTPRNAFAPVRAESVAVAFVELPHRDFTARWTDLAGTRDLRPRLVYQVRSTDGVTGANRRQRPIELFVDGRLYFRKRLQSRSGEIALPKVDANDAQGDKLFRLQAPDNVRVFVSYLDVPEAPKYLKRLAHRVSGSRNEKARLQIPYQKQSDAKEVVMLRTFSPIETTTPRPVDIRVHIIPSQNALSSARRSTNPTNSQTITKRVFSVTPSSSEVSVPIGASQSAYSGGESCVLSLGEDLPAGDYRIDIEANEETYLMLYRSLPGRTPSRSLFYEENEG